MGNFVDLISMNRISGIWMVFMALVSCISAPCKPMQSPAGPNAIDITYFEKERVFDNGHLSVIDTASGAFDFGRIFHQKPAAILRPDSAQEIAEFLRAVYEGSSKYSDLTVAAKGAGHSIYGQAQATDGVVIDMLSLTAIKIHEEHEYAEVGAGALWADLLVESLKVGLAPRSWTDYLYLTVGGTLSNAGIGGQTFRHGPQISNVLQFDIVTGTGELRTCSATQNEDLFYAAMGGLGQFGIITRARIILEPAPRRVRWIRIFYNDFEHFTRDQELMLSMEGTVDYLEGFMVLNNEAMRNWFVGFPATTPLNESFFFDMGTNNIYFCIEIAKYSSAHDETFDMDNVMERIISRLSFIPSTVYSAEVSYLDFLNRVRAEELYLRSSSQWEVPHPWLNLFVPRTHIHRFTTNLLSTKPPHGVKGPLLIYPVTRNKWNDNMSAVLPEDDDHVFYVVGMLRSVDPECLPGSSCMENLLLQNKKIVDISTRKEMEIDAEEEVTEISCGMGAKQYLPYYLHQWQWKNHFGRKWERFLERKARYDPLNILAPGQRILKRKSRTSEL